MTVARPFAESPASTWFNDTVVQLPASARDGIPPCHWMATASAFADTGGLMSGDELADRIRQRCLLDVSLRDVEPVSLVARWIVSRAVVSIESPWGHMLPVFQFNLSRAALHPGVPIVLAELGGVLEGAELALWFVTPNEWLHGERPALAMQTMLPAVRHAARAAPYVARGG